MCLFAICPCELFVRKFPAGSGACERLSLGESATCLSREVLSRAVTSWCHESAPIDGRSWWVTVALVARRGCHGWGNCGGGGVVWAGVALGERHSTSQRKPCVGVKRSRVVICWIRDRRPRALSHTPPDLAGRIFAIPYERKVSCWNPSYGFVHATGWCCRRPLKGGKRTKTSTALISNIHVCCVPHGWVTSHFLFVSVGTDGTLNGTEMLLICNNTCLLHGRSRRLSCLSMLSNTCAATEWKLSCADLKSGSSGSTCH